MHTPFPLDQVMIVNFFAGSLSDCFGRRRILLIFAAIHVIFSYLTTVANSYWFYLGVRYYN